MKIEFFKEKRYVKIEFHKPEEEMFFRMLCKTWAVQDDKLEEVLGMLDDAVMKYNKTHKPWLKKKIKTIRWFIKKIWDFDMGNKSDVVAFADGIVTMVEIGQFIEEAFQKGHGHKGKNMVELPKKLIN